MSEYGILVGKKIFATRRAKKMSRAELGQKVGLHETTLKKYEDGDIQRVSVEVLQSIAIALDISPSYLIGWEPSGQEDQSDKMQLKKIPLLGNVACGEPIFAIKDADEYVPLFDDVKADFCVRAKGDSMAGANIYDGDIIFAHSQNMVDNGEIAVVIIGEEATLKRVYYYPQENKLLLASENPKYAPLSYSGRELEQVRIIGKAVVHYGIIK